MELMATKQDVYNIVQRIKYLPNSPIKNGNANEVVEMFFVILKDLSFDLLDKATLFYLGQENPFFPMPGAIREKALELQMIALKIPTPAEAWGMVLNRNTIQPGVMCEVSAKLHEEAKLIISGEYLLKIKEINQHENECAICKPTTFDASYAHPIVARTVQLLGGLDAILSDNPVADRARFIPAYQEVLARERAVIGMIPEVAQYVYEKRLAFEEERRAAFETGEAKAIRQLANRMRK